MRKYSFLLILTLLVLSACKKEDENDEPASVHNVTVFSNESNIREASLGQVTHNGNILYYCGITDENGEPEMVVSATFDPSNTQSNYHYLFDDQGRVVIAYSSQDGQNNSEIHKLTYGALDSVYYSVHQFDWSNGLNFLEYQVGFGKFNDEYMGTSLYEKSGATALEDAGSSLALFTNLSLQLNNALDTNFTSEQAGVANSLSAIVDWNSPTISEGEPTSASSSACVFYDNLPNPTGTPNSPSGNQDQCFDSNISVSGELEVNFGERFINLEVSGGSPPYGVFFDGSAEPLPLFVSFPAPDIGLYQFEIVDDNGCQAFYSIVLNDICESSSLELNLSSEPGSASASVSGGASPYTYSWSTGWQGTSISNLAPGVYACTVTDSELCTVSDSIQVEGKCEGQTMIIDVDGNEYAVVEIGGQCWMAENIKTTKYQNGDNIPEVSDVDVWQNLISGARIAYEDDADNIETYGYLYNAPAAEDESNVCPAGWHVPTSSEYQVLINSTGGNEVAGLNLKSTSLWSEDGTNWPGSGNNSSGWNAKPGGLRTANNENNDFTLLGISGRWWFVNANSVGHFRIAASDHSVYVSNNSGSLLEEGYSIRCVKD
jgi:uncharacterized protein (TIGR02145 family)